MGKIKKNIFYQILYQILAIILPLVTTPIITRALGADGLGKYSYTYAIVNYFSLFAMLGINSYGVREIARIKTTEDKEVLSKTFLGIYTLQVTLSLIVIALYYVYSIICAYELKVLTLLQGIFLVGTMTDVSWFYFGMEQFRVTVVRNIFVKIICGFIIVCFIREPEDIYLYAITMIGSNVISNLILVVALRKQIGFYKISYDDVVKHIKPNLILFIPVVASSIYVYMDKIMLGQISGSVQTGYYEAMEKLINVPVACIAAITVVMFPRISVLVKQKENKIINQYLSLSILSISAFAIVCFWGMVAVADLFVPIFFGVGFSNATVVIVLGCIIPLPRGIRGAIKSEYLLPKGMDKEAIIAIVCGAVFNLVANAVLMPFFGAIGAVIATILAEIVSCGISFFFARKELNLKHIFVINIPFFFFGGSMYLLMEYSKSILDFNLIVNLLLLIAIGGGFYCLLSFTYIRFLIKKDKI